jgi:hypothetical protein
VSNHAFARVELGVDVLLASSLGGAVLLRIALALDGPLDLTVFSVVGNSVVLGVRAVAEVLGCIDCVAESFDALSAVVTKVDLLAVCVS